MKLTLLIILAYSNLIFTDVVENLYEIKNPKPARILFVGNSYLYYNDSLHNHLRRMVEESFPDYIDLFEFKSATIGGAKLSHHNIDHLLEYKNLEVSKPFELVILQGGSSEHLTEESRKNFLLHAELLTSKVKDSGSDAALYMIHAYVKPHEDYDPGMLGKVVALYDQAGKITNTNVLPVGIAFANAYKEKPNLKLHKDFDGTHPDILGTYLAACVLYASIYKKSPIGITYNYFDSINDEDIKFLQQVAHKTVEDFYNFKLIN